MEQQNRSEFKIKSKCDLKAYINAQILKIKQLDDVGEKDKSQKLANNISYLSEKFNLGGMIIDPLTDTKYFVSLGQLRGGWVTYADEWSGHQSTRLYDTDLEVIRKEISTLTHLDGDGSIRPIHRVLPLKHSIIIRNLSSYPLEYCNCGVERGYFFTGYGSPARSFRGPNQTIEPGYSAGFAYTENELVNPFGCRFRGYVSFRLQTPKDVYIIIFGWGINPASENKAGVEIRSRNQRNVEPNGVVTDMNKFLIVTHPEGNGFHDFNSKQVGEFQLTCQFDNNEWAEYILTVANG